MRVRSRDRDTVQFIAWVKLGRDDDEVEQQIYDLNPHLHSYGRVLPAGVVIELPEITDTTTTEVDEQVTIWS
ncbi:MULTISPECIES: tail protein X [Enterobacteriaceae]|jgi:phage tail protein X|uniref:Tail protein X n=1 Tax=Pseudocitrobacter vendiensis TaxID=2488306 RepID=A0ABM9FG07_9ENTR|nr:MULTISPECIES: tail protein X [Enterobacteriaceae]ECV6025644.1 phage tail protein [Salmonella enterica]ECY2423219.1 phage tail protein [Salmonella enterica]EIK0943997.1 tail protein X [Salmonella enterica]EMA3598633.1 tail protein X [Salmonella enterica]MCW8353750.1 tail protein X [Citrobacter portucalensis]